MNSQIRIVLAIAGLIFSLNLSTSIAQRFTVSGTEARGDTLPGKSVDVEVDLTNPTNEIMQMHVDITPIQLPTGWSIAMCIGDECGFGSWTFDANMPADSTLPIKLTANTGPEPDSIVFTLKVYDLNNPSQFVELKYTVVTRASVTVQDIATAKASQLGNSFPNPVSFSENGAAIIPYSVVGGQPTSIYIYNIQGDIVATLSSGSGNNGTGLLRWNGHDDQGRLVSPGLYFVQMTSSSNSSMKSIIVH